MALLKVLL